jgi:hypothetical protein
MSSSAAMIFYGVGPFHRRLTVRRFSSAAGSVPVGAFERFPDWPKPSRGSKAAAFSATTVKQRGRPRIDSRIRYEIQKMKFMCWISPLHRR